MSKLQISESMLEFTMASCTTEHRLVAGADSNADYVGFRRNGMLYGFRLVSGTAHKAKGITREGIDTLIQILGEENILERVERPVEQVAHIKSYPFEIKKEYIIPKNAQLIRRSNKQIKFFLGESLENGKQRRKFIPIMGGAVAVMSEGQTYKWKMPDGNGGYCWK